MEESGKVKLSTDEVIELLEEFRDRYKTMRENGDSDMRTVIFHVNKLIDDIDETFGEGSDSIFDDDSWVDGPELGCQR